MMAGANSGLLHWRGVCRHCLILCLCFTAVAAISCVLSGCSRNIAFDSAAWKAQRGRPNPDKPRALMVLDLERNHLKAGMTQQAVKGLLGEPDQPTGRRLLSYGFGMGAGYLDTYFSQRERLTHWKVSGCSCNIAFDSTAWKALRDGPDPNSPRGLMVADLERHHLKVGMTPQAVKGLLGEPELPSGRRQLSYFLGISDYRMGMDSLVIYFSQRERLTHWKVSGCSRCIAFDSPAWKAEHGNTQPENPRGLMVTDLERHHLKVGMTSQAVKGLLGEPDRPSARRLLSYNLGFWSGYGVDMDSLDIYFSQRERVTHWKVQQH